MAPIQRTSEGAEGALPRLIEFLEHNTHDARFFGVELDVDGCLDRRDARALLPRVVVVEITLSRQPGREGDGNAGECADRGL